MRINRIFSRMSALLICLVLMLTLLPTTAFAYERINTGRKTSLTVQYPCEDVTFRLYRVADVDTYRRYTLCDVFADYPITLEQVDQAAWRALAETLSGYVARDGITPERTGTTNAQGQLTFSDLPVGLYLLVGEKKEYEDATYTCKPALIALPGLNSSDRWNYDVSASPKYDKEIFTHVKVIKVWKNNSSAKIPDEIEVQLLRDSTVWDTVKLNEANNWRHTWRKLDPQYTWRIVEKNVPPSYTVTVQREGPLVTITNSRTPAQPGGGGGGGPKDPKDPQNPEDPQNQPKLPQTGVLWWPVGLLAAGGILMLFFGCIRRNHRHE